MKQLKNDSIFYTIIFCCGLFLSIAELFKQLLIYFVVNQREYDWWFFPFHLCSVPMYLCLALPWLSRKYKTIVCTFIQDFNLLGAIAALIVPSGFPRTHWYLLLHAYVWHILLVLLGLLILAAGRADNRIRGYLHTLPLFFACCVIATIINLLATGADMFYISPYHPTTQIVFHQISMKLGIIPGHIIYLLTICLGAFILHQSFKHLPDMAANLWRNAKQRTYSKS